MRAEESAEASASALQVGREEGWAHGGGGEVLGTERVRELAFQGRAGSRAPHQLPCCLTTMQMQLTTQHLHFCSPSPPVLSGGKAGGGRLLGRHGEGLGGGLGAAGPAVDIDVAKGEVLGGGNGQVLAHTLAAHRAGGVGGQVDVLRRGRREGRAVPGGVGGPGQGLGESHRGAECCSSSSPKTEAQPYPGTHSTQASPHPRQLTMAQTGLSMPLLLPDSPRKMKAPSTVSPVCSCTLVTVVLACRSGRVNGGGGGWQDKAGAQKRGAQAGTARAGTGHVHRLIHHPSPARPAMKATAGSQAGGQPHSPAARR